MQVVQTGFNATDGAVFEIVSSNEVVVTKGTVWVELAGGKVIVRDKGVGYGVGENTEVVLESKSAKGYAVHDSAKLIKFPVTEPKPNGSKATGCTAAAKSDPMFNK